MAIGVLVGGWRGELMINLFQPALGAEELEAIRDVFQSNWIGKGAVTDQFESNFAAHLDVDRGLVRSVSTCTEALFQSMTLLQIGPGDEVVLPTISHVSAANAVAASGARPVFCDVDERTLNTSAHFIDERITERTKAVVILHYGGVPCEMASISTLVEQRGVALVEDSACSIASRYDDQTCGTFGDIGTWSFDPMKTATTGDGGMIYCRNPEHSARLDALIGLGVSPSSGLANHARGRWWEFEVLCHGRRATMNDLTAAIGVVQLRKLPQAIARRREIHSYYDRELGSLPWLAVPPVAGVDVESSHYFYWVQTEPGVRDRLAVHLRNKEVYSTFRYYPLHRVKQFDATGCLEHAEQAAETTLCIPNHQSLSDEDMATVVAAIVEFGNRL